MTTKLKLASKILRILAGGDRGKDFKIDEREIALDIDQFRSQFIEEEYAQNELLGRQMIPAEYIRPYRALPLLADSGQKYLELPARPIKLPNDKGIYAISPLNEPGNIFIPIYNGHSPLGYGLESSWLENRCGYYPEGKRIYFVGNTDKLYQNNDPLQMPKAFNVKIIIDSQDIGIGEELPLAAGMEARIMAAIFQTRFPGLGITQDKIDDEVS